MWQNFTELLEWVGEHFEDPEIKTYNEHQHLVFGIFNDIWGQAMVRDNSNVVVVWYSKL